MVSPVVKCHPKDVIPPANVMKATPTVPNPVRGTPIVPVARCVCVASAVPNVVPTDHVQLASCVSVEPALLVAKQTMTVPPTRPVSRVSVVILVPIRNPVAVMPCAQCRNIACYAIVPMAMRVNRTRNVFNSNVNTMKIVRPTNAVTRVNVVIHAWNSVPAASMPSAVLSIAGHNAPAHRTSLAMQPQSVNRLKVVVTIIHAVRIHAAPKFPVAMNVPAWKVVLEMPKRVVYAMEILLMYAAIKFVV